MKKKWRDETWYISLLKLVKKQICPKLWNGDRGIESWLQYKYTEQPYECMLQTRHTTGWHRAPKKQRLSPTPFSIRFEYCNYIVCDTSVWVRMFYACQQYSLLIWKLLCVFFIYSDLRDKYIFWNMTRTIFKSRNVTFTLKSEFVR